MRDDAKTEAVMSPFVRLLRTAGEAFVCFLFALGVITALLVFAMAGAALIYVLGKAI